MTLKLERRNVTVILSCINHDFVIVYEPAFNFVDPYNHVTTLKPSL